MSNRRKTAYIAIAALLGFWLLSKALNALSGNPGAQLYETKCAQCHGAKGEGLAALLPPLNQVDWLAEHQDQLPCIILHGLKDSILVNGQWYNEEMLGIENLNEVQVANLTNYISKQFTLKKKFYTQEEISALLDKCKH